MMKKIFYLLLLLFTFSSCDDDGDDGGEGIVYDVCSDGLVYVDSVRSSQTQLAESTIPQAARAHIAAEFPGYVILQAIEFTTLDGQEFLEIEINSIGFLLFDENNNYLCVIEDYPTIDNPIDTNPPVDSLVLISDLDTCPTNVISFERQVLPLLASGCAYGGCHDAISAEDNVILTDYNNIIQQISPNNISQSKIYEVITWPNQNQDKFMPPLPAISFTTEQINLIADWINQGAPNNDCKEVCNSTNTSFSADIKPLIVSQCLGCHQPTNDLGGVSLSSYQEVLTYANNGKLLGSIKHQPGYEAMPEVALKMTDCQIAQIQNWIFEGAKDN